MGRRLESATRSNGSKVTYTYNADGLLTSKKVGLYKLDYYWNGDKLTAQTDGVNTWYFRYDGDTPIGLEFNGVEYYYVTNLQGDVIVILDSNGAVAAEYEYDAWGNCTVTKDTNTIALDNPIRYRGYYYDVHIGLYYLQSRFYDANTGRFINADEPTLIGANGGVVSNNLFAYCDNNPVMGVDPSGYFYVLRLFNCYSYAMGIVNLWLHPGFKKGYKLNNNLTVDTLKKYVLSDFSNIRELKSKTDKLKKGEYRIALRVCRQPIPQVYGSTYRDYFWDFHFWKQDPNTLYWWDKPGKGNIRCKGLANPDSKYNWFIGKLVYYRPMYVFGQQLPYYYRGGTKIWYSDLYYASKTIYFAVEGRFWTR